MRKKETVSIHKEQIEKLEDAADVVAAVQRYLQGVLPLNSEYLSILSYTVGTLNTVTSLLDKELLRKK